MHISLFGCLLLLDANMSYLIQNSSPVSIESTIETSSIPDGIESLHLGQARWLISGALSAVLLCMTLVALLNESVNTKRSLVVNNRYLRLGLRGIVVIVLLLLPIKQDISIGLFLAIIVGMLQVTVWWELITGLERGIRLIEPAEEH